MINVLIVDDDPMVAELNRRYLEQVDGFRWQGSVSTIQAAKQMLLEGDTPIDLVLLDIKSSDPETYRKVTKQDLAPTLRFAERLKAMGKPVWVRYVLVPGLTDAEANVEGVAKLVASMPNVEWVEVLPFHQLGSFKWKELGLEYQLENTPPATPELVERVLGQFRAAGCNAR